MVKEVTTDEFQNSLNSNSVIQVLDQKGITLNQLADYLNEELKANEIKCFNDKGTVIYSKDLAALDIRQRARVDAHKLRGDYPAEKHEVSGSITVDTGIKREGDE